MPEQHEACSSCPKNENDSFAPESKNAKDLNRNRWIFALAFFILYSSGCLIASRLPVPATHTFFRCIAGFCALALPLAIGWKKIVKYSPIFIAVGILLLFGALASPPIRGGHHFVGLGGMYFMPVWLVCPVLPLLMAYFAEENHLFTTGKCKWVGIIGIPVLVIAILSIMHFTTAALLLLLLFFVLLFISGKQNWKIVTGTGLFFLLCTFLRISRKSAVCDRIIDFFIERNPLTHSYVLHKVHEALLACNWTGRISLAPSTEKILHYSPVAKSQIIPVACVEFGLIYAIVVLLAFILLLLSGWSLMKACRHIPGRLIVGGGIAWFAMCGAGNLATTIGIFPMTTYMFPFLSPDIAFSAGNMFLMGTVFSYMDEYLRTQCKESTEEEK